MKKMSLSQLKDDRDAAFVEWQKFYRSLPKYGRASKDAYKENGLYTRFKNRERKYNEALDAARNLTPK